MTRGEVGRLVGAAVCPVVPSRPESSIVSVGGSPASGGDHEVPIESGRTVHHLSAYDLVMYLQQIEGSPESNSGRLEIDCDNYYEVARLYLVDSEYGSRRRKSV